MLLLPVLLIPSPANAQASRYEEVFKQLAPCNFNAYTEREDLIIGGFAFNLRTGVGCGQNLDRRFPTASVGKLFIAGAFYTLVAQGTLSFDTEVTFTETYFMRGRDDCLTQDRIGQNITLGDLGDMMIWCSDNAATWMLMDYIGRDTVQRYIDSLGIAGIGEVLPYSEVDRLKLSLLDERWANVPLHLASQFYRNLTREGYVPPELVPTYFPAVPRYTPEQFRAANARYQAETTYNTMTPRALATYMLRLRDDAAQPTLEGQVARWLFNTMLLTQRVYSTQEFPGTVYVGSKNGYDLGLRAEVNITVSTLNSGEILPDTISLVFAHYRDVTHEDVPLRFLNTDVEQLLKHASVKLHDLLFPAALLEPPIVTTQLSLTGVALNSRELLFPCWGIFQQHQSVTRLAECWAEVPLNIEYTLDEEAGIGVLLQGLEGQDVRISFIFTLPDGTHWAFQYQRFFQEQAAFAVFDTLYMKGTWRVDAYVNLTPVFTQRFYVR